ncbi:MAG: glycosyltransferase [Dehalococcoidia bacterium]
MTVYNNELLLNRVLIPSIKNQTVKCEFIPVDNTHGQFKSAAAALNFGAEQAYGEYIMFIHQDVELGSPLWLEAVESILNNIPDLGVAGIAGMSEKGRNDFERRKGYGSDSGKIWSYSNAANTPAPVQTVDDCLLLIPKSVFNELKFDEITFDGWHCYGVDYCLSVSALGLKAYSIPLFIYHRSLQQNMEYLIGYQRRLYNKHKSNHKVIYTTCGNISWLSLNWRSIKKNLQPLYRRLFPALSTLLKNAVANCDMVLDLGCGYSSLLQYCNVPFSVGVELFEPYLEESSKKGIHSQYIRADVREIEFVSKSFDAVIAMDVLEHLTKEEGAILLAKMEQWCRKKVVISTPNGYIWQDDCNNNPLEQHKSGWSTKEFRELGFKVYGVAGWKQLRGYRAEIKYTPVFLFRIISDLTQKITYRFPQLAFQLLVIKTIEDK